MQFRDLNRQYLFLKEQIDYSVNNVISSGRYINGPEVLELEQVLSDYVGTKHCITCANGTDAISIAIKALGIGKGDAVFVPDFTFFSTGESPADEGATPIFVDINPLTYNVDPNKLENAINSVIAEKKYNIKAVIAVDLFGQPADFDKIRKICDKYKLFLIEDAAQGFGGRINDKKACGFGDISITSFFPAKPLGCYGDGGAIFTNSDELANMIRSICVHGKDTSNKDDALAKYNNVRIGRNSRLDTIQAAILLAKFKAFVQYELDDVNNVAEWYYELLKDTGLVLPKVSNNYFSSWAQYTIQIPDNVDRTVFQQKLKKVGIPTMIYYTKPMHMQKAFSGICEIVDSCLVTKELCNKVLSLPIDPYKKRTEIEFVAKEIKNALNRKEE